MTFSMNELGNNMSSVTNIIWSKRDNGFDANYNRQVESIFQQVLQENLQQYASSLSAKDNGDIQYITSIYDQGFGSDGAKNGKIDASELLEMSTHVDWFFDPNNKGKDKWKDTSEPVKEFFVNLFKNLGAALSNIEKYLGSHPPAAATTSAATTTLASSPAQTQNPTLSTQTQKPSDCCTKIDLSTGQSSVDSLAPFIKIKPVPKVNPPSEQLEVSIKPVPDVAPTTSPAVTTSPVPAVSSTPTPTPTVSASPSQSQSQAVSQPAQNSAPAKPTRSELLQQIASKGISNPNIYLASYEELVDIAEHGNKIDGYSQSVMSEINSNLSYRNNVLAERLSHNGINKNSYQNYDQIVNEIAAYIRESLTKLGGTEFRSLLETRIGQYKH